MPQEVGRERKRSGAAARRTIEPAFVIGLYASRSPASSSRPHTSSGSLRSCSRYNTLAAMVFAGAARYRMPWDFLLAILAAFALAAAWERVRWRRRRYAGGARARW